METFKTLVEGSGTFKKILSSI